MDKDQRLVLIYLFFWILTFLIYYRKRKRFDVGCFVLASYIVYAISSFLLYNTHYINFSPYPLKLFPFIYLYVMLLVGLLPILKFNTNDETPIKQPSMPLINTISVIFIVSTLIHFPSSVMSIANGLTKILSDTSGGQELYSDSLDLIVDTGSGVSNLAAVISNAFTQVGFFLTVYYWTLEKKRKLISVLLFISCLMKMLSGISLGQRGGIVEPLMILIATYFLLKDYLSPVYKRVARVTGLLLVLVLSIPVLYITISRFDTKVSDPLESTCYYMGIENINFNNFALDNNGIRYGDRTIPLFKRMVGFRNVPRNYIERRNKYPNLKMNDQSFITYVGDIAIDYGPIATVIILCLLSYIITNKTKLLNGQIEFHQILLIHFWLYLCVLGGFKLFTYADTGGNLKIIVFLITYMLLKNDSAKQIKLKQN